MGLSLTSFGRSARPLCPLAAFIVVALGIHAVAARAEPPSLDLGAALRAAGFVATWTEHGDAIVAFDSSDPVLREAWPITVRSVRNGEWVLIYATLLDGDPDRPFSTEILTQALAFNAEHAGSKFVLDEARGDLDVQVEIPATGFSSSLLRQMVHDVAATCDTEWPRFRALAEAASGDGEP